MRVLGIDPSTRTGWAVVGVGYETKKGTLPVGKDSGLIRALRLANEVTTLMERYAPDLVVIEGYGYGNTNTLALLVEIGTLIRERVYYYGIPFIIVAPTSLKKFVAGKGNANKDKMLLEAYKRWGVEGTNDEVDAFGLGMFGLAVYGHVSSPKSHTEAVTKWKKENTVPDLSP